MPCLGTCSRSLSLSRPSFLGKPPVKSLIYHSIASSLLHLAHRSPSAACHISGPFLRTSPGLATCVNCSLRSVVGIEYLWPCCYPTSDPQRGQHQWDRSSLPSAAVVVNETRPWLLPSDLSRLLSHKTNSLRLHTFGHRAIDITEFNRICFLFLTLQQTPFRILSSWLSAAKSWSIWPLAHYCTKSGRSPAP